MKLKDLEILFHKELDATYGKEEVGQFFYLCIEVFYQLSRLDLALDTNLSITTNEQSTILNALNDLKRQVPIQYILGETEFYGLPFKVTRDTLIPRPETEELVALICEDYKAINREISILDIGTGSGCIPISLAKKITKAKVSSIDVSSKALDIAKTNARLNDVLINFKLVNVLEENQFNDAFDEEMFDVIVSNPPYVRDMEKSEMKPNVLDYEPHLALFVADADPLIFYRKITELAKEYLKPKGKLYFEINEYLGKEMELLVTEHGFTEVNIHKDVFNKDRMLSAIKQ